jgi:hypothetical protein
MLGTDESDLVERLVDETDEIEVREGRRRSIPLSDFLIPRLGLSVSGASATPSSLVVVDDSTTSLMRRVGSILLSRFFVALPVGVSRADSSSHIAFASDRLSDRRRSGRGPSRLGDF